MRVAIVGSSGLVGGFLTKQLIEDASVSEVHIFARATGSFTSQKVTYHVGDLLDVESRDFEGVLDAAFCCLGTTMKKAGSKSAFEEVDKKMVLAFARFAKKHQARFFASVSSMGANPNSHIFYSRVKGVVEKELSKIGLERLAIVRPSLILGERGEERFGESMGKVLSKVISPFLLGSLRHYKPVHAKQIAQKMMLLWKQQQDKERIVLSGDILKA